MLKNTLSSALAVVLAGCNPTPTTLTMPACPSLPEYGKDVQAAAANELDTLPDGTVLKELFIPDYQRMRDGTRACRKGVAP